MQLPTNAAGLKFDLSAAIPRWVVGAAIGVAGGVGHALILHADWKVTIGYGLVGLATGCGFDWSKFKNATE